MRKENRKRSIVSGETIEKTFGCRHSQPDICKENGRQGACAFVRPDKWCHSPPKSWPKLHKELSGGSSNDTK